MKAPLVSTLLLLAASLPVTGLARTQLVTLPERTLLITSLENAAQPLLMEERTLSLQEGTNQINFTWQNVDIHPESVELQVVGADDIRVISTGFPSRGNSLTWEVYSPRDIAQPVRVSYLLNGITQVTSYELHLGSSETEGEFRQYILISNVSGEDLVDAVIRAPFLGEIDRSLRNRESRRLLAKSVDALPLEKLFVSNPSWHHHAGEDGETISMVYELSNIASAGLGEARLPAGKIRVFATPDGDGSVFLGEDNITATAPGESASARLGVVSDVVLERSKMRDRQTNQRRNPRQQVVVFDQEIQLRYTLKNFKDEPVTIRVHERPPSGEWEATTSGHGDVRLERLSINELVVEIDLPAAVGEDPAEVVIDLDFLFRNRLQSDR
ncbi:MAG: hypothetical protein JJU11_12060 [Candidatus Sumerlaeia bacterium]|nr:hypothetical protein [Candidatus Sumerlaeia bacterium]